MNEVLTKRDLVEQGIEAIEQRKIGSTIQITNAGGGITLVDVPQVIQMAKIMAAAGDAVPPHMRGNVGACMRVVLQAVSWKFEPFYVGDQSFFVSGRMAYMSQMIHALVEARAPLSNRLNCKFTGEGQERRVTVIGRFLDGSERDYTSPAIKDIKVKNSPLWVSDPDQQLWYYGSRAWARRWCPDVIGGIYTRDEIMENARIGREDASPEENQPGLHSRLIDQQVDRTEGHEEGHVEREMNGDKPVEIIDQETGEVTEEPKPKKARGRKAKEEKAPEQEAASTPEVEQPTAGRVDAALPKTPQGYITWCQVWASALTDPDQIKARWDSERRMRNECGITSEERDPLMSMINQRIDVLRAISNRKTPE